MCRVGWKRQLTTKLPTALPCSGLAYAQVTTGQARAGAQSPLRLGHGGLLRSTRSMSQPPARDTAGPAPHPASAHTHQGTRGPGSAPDGQSSGASNPLTDGQSLVWAQGSTPTGEAWTLGRQGSGGRAAAGQGAKPSMKGSHPAPDGQVTPLFKQWGNVGTRGQSCSVAQACPNLCDPKHCSRQSSVHRISQARILEWVAISFSTESPVLSGGIFTPRTQSAAFKCWP